jgi:hypothetical protein
MDDDIHGCQGRTTDETRELCNCCETPLVPAAEAMTSEMRGKCDTSSPEKRVPQWHYIKFTIMTSHFEKQNATRNAKGARDAESPYTQDFMRMDAFPLLNE